MTASNTIHLISICSKIMKKLIFSYPAIIFFAFHIFSCSTFISAGKIIEISDGYNWSLPDHVHPTPFTGWAESEKYREKWEEMYPSSSTDPDEIYYHRVIGFNWADVNPEIGVFNWSIIDAEIQKIEDEPHTCFSLLPGIWSKKSLKEGLQHYPYGGWHDLIVTDTWGTNLRQFLYPMIPEWVNTTYLSTGLAAAWDPRPENNYFEALEDFINALAKRYRDHPRFGWVHCPFLDYAWGEGCFRAPRNTDDEQREAYVKYAINKTGLTPENMETYLNLLVNIYANAFKGKEGQIVWTSVENELGPLGIYGGDKYNQAKERGWKYAIMKGFGGRDGQVEVWMRYLTEGYGNVIDENGYLIMNDDYQPIKNGVVWYTENENWSKHFVPNESSLFYVYKTRVMRLLQMRRNWEWGGLEKALEFPELGRYVQLSLGKTIENSVDAWCWPRESYVPAGGEIVPVKNFERWLYQRDIGSDGMTKPTRKIDISQLNQWASAYDYEFEARQTDVQTGNNSMYFNIDERWFGKHIGGCKFLVTFFDNSSALWQVEYCTEKGIARSDILSQENSGKIKTAVFEIPGVMATGELGKNMDLKIKTLNEEDVTVLFARIVKN